MACPANITIEDYGCQWYKQEDVEIEENEGIEN